jgi:hypothetical protein
MGDRCWLQITLHGHVASRKSLVRIAKGIIADGLTTELFDDHRDGVTVHTVIARIAEAWGSNTNPVFYSDEVNYANIDDLENLLTVEQVAWSVDHAAGGEYPAGSRSWSPEHGHAECAEANGWSVVPVYIVEQMLEKPDAVELLKGMIDEAYHARGIHLPTFSCEERVGRMLARLQAVEALKIAG